jgi:hypothetical protein
VPKSPNTFARIGPWLILLLVIGFAAFIRVRVADTPLERDEGEYAYAGQGILQGIPPYKLAYNMKLPGTYAAYAVLMAIFGETTRGIHLGLTLINAVTILLVFLVGRKLFSPAGGLVAAASFALLSVSHALLGMAAHANHFVVLFAVAGIHVLLRGQELKLGRWFFWSGLLMGLAFLMKQQGLFFILFGLVSILGFWLKDRSSGWKTSLRFGSYFSLGAIAPFLLTCLVLWRSGVFERFWFWTFSYANAYGSIVTWREGIGHFRSNFDSVFLMTGWFWIAAALGLVVMLARQSTRSTGFWLLALLAASGCALATGFYFRPHYFLLVLPCVSLLVAAAFEWLSGLFRGSRAAGWVATTAFASVFCYTTYIHRAYFFRLSPTEICITRYGDNPFSKTDTIGRYIQQHSKPDATVAVIGSEPQIYFTAHRRSATGYIYTYPLMEPQPFALQMQKEMISEIEASKPEFIVMVMFEFSWLASTASHRTILDWSTDYCNRLYRPVGLVDFLAPDKVEEHWDEAMKSGPPPKGHNFMVIFQRKEKA